MSYPIHVYNVCEKCGHKFKTIVDTRINAAVIADTQKIGKDILNMLECPSCGHKSRANISVFYDDILEKSAVWFKPCEGTDDLYKMINDFFMTYKDGRYVQNVDIETTNSWEEFKEKTSRLMTKTAFSMAFKPNVNMAAEMKARMVAGLAYEMLIDKEMDNALSISHDKPEFTLKDGSCFYTGKKESIPTKKIPTKRQSVNNSKKKVFEPMVTRTDSYEEVKILAVIAGLIFLLVLLTHL